MVEREITPDQTQHLVDTSRIHVENYSKLSGLDAFFVASTLSHFANSAYGNLVNDEKGVANFRKLRDNDFFNEFLNSQFLRDVNEELGFYSFPGTDPKQREEVFVAAHEALQKLVKEYSE